MSATSEEQSILLIINDGFGGLVVCQDKGKPTCSEQGK